MTIYVKRWLVYALILFVIPQAAYAATFFAHDTIATSSVIKDDVYAVGTTVHIGHEIQGDLIAAGNHVEVTAPVAGDVFSAGESVNILTSVGDDLHIAASRATIRGEVADDLFVGGEYVDIGEASAVAGDTYVAARNATIQGTFAGSLYIASEHAVIESGTAIHGDLVFSGQRPSLASGVQIDGTTRHAERHNRPSRPSPIARWVFGVVMWFVTGYVLVRLFPFLSVRTLSTLRRTMLRSAAAGIFWTLAWLPFALVLLITFIGIPLSLLLILGTLLLYFAATGYAVTALGVWVIETISGRRTQDVIGSEESPDTPKQSTSSTYISWQHVLLGAVLYKSILLVPAAGRFLVLALIVAAAGALLRTLLHLLRGEAL